MENSKIYNELQNYIISSFLIRSLSLFSEVTQKKRGSEVTIEILIHLCSGVHETWKKRHLGGVFLS